MIPEIPPGLIQGGLSTIVAVAVYLVLSGRLVPRSTLRDVQKERDEWRKTALSAIAQNGQLLHGARVVNDVLQALPTQPTGTHDGAGDRG